jgi:hypothetical protein
VPNRDIRISRGTLPRNGKGGQAPIPRDWTHPWLARFLPKQCASGSLNSPKRTL